MAVSIVAAGILGPHVPMRSAPAPGSPRPSLAKMELPGVREPNPIFGLPGLAQLSPAPFDLAYSVLPNGILSRSVAAIGTRIFFIVDDNRIMSTVVGWSSQPTVLADAPACHSIDEIAAAGHEMAYVESWPIGLPFESSGCGSPSSMAWSIWLLDLQGGAPRLTSAGVASGQQAATRPDVHVAVGDTTYAYNRPGSSAGGGSVIEVRSLSDNSLSWSTGTGGSVAALMLGGSHLAVLESSPDPASAGPSLELADPAHPILRTVSHPGSAASISRDGSYLAWDVPDEGPQTPGGVDVQVVGTGATTFVAAPSGATAPKPLQPVVSAAATGPIVAWRATADGGSVYPAFRTSANAPATAIASAQTTAWVNLQGTMLLWIAAAVDGSLGVAYAIDLAGARTQP